MSVYIYIVYIYRSLAKEGPLWNIHPPPPPPPQFSLDFSLKLIWKSTQLGQAFQIVNSHCLTSLRLWWVFFTHSTRWKLHCCTLVYTSTRCLAQDVTHYLHYFTCFVVPNIDACNVSPPPMKRSRAQTKLLCQHFYPHISCMVNFNGDFRGWTLGIPKQKLYGYDQQSKL